MTKKYLFIFAIVLFAPVLCQAQETSLGNFSVADVQKLFGSPILLHLKEQKITVDKSMLQSWIKIRPSLEISPKYNSEVENINFNPADNASTGIYFRFLGRKQDDFHTRISTSLVLDETALKNFLEKEKGDTRVSPDNAKLSFADGKVSAFGISKEGYELSVDDSVALIAKTLQENPSAKNIELPSVSLQPDITLKDIEKYGIRELIGEGVSNFRGSPKNRIHNITVGAAKFNGVLIKPGEEFSFINTLGPVDETTGYLPELVIKVDKTIPEYGGGMCQVSTTMFRAALNSGLKITARTNHAYPVQYYAPQGLDATVYIPKPDLKFVNDTPAYILVQTRIEGTQLLFDFYGTSDGRQAKLVGPFVTSRGADGAMKTVVTQEVYDKDGNLVRKSEFKSNYDSPSKYPHPGQEKITEKPTDWSNKEWKEYKKANGL